ncbi:MAG: cytochrome c biogenesis protein CcsA [Planctomycetes bacterium]|nr:cytochrome c biogenesis protein CcsA [Planctomycetota bacterium]
MNYKTEQVLPWIVVVLAALYVGSKAMPPSPKSGEMDLYAFGSIPVQDNGRIKPMDTFARSSLILITKKTEFEDEKGKKQPATRFMLDVLASHDSELSGPGTKLRIFRIDFDQMLDLLRLKQREGYRYTLQEINENRFSAILKLKDGGTKDISIAEARKLFDAGQKENLEIVDNFKKRVDIARRIADDDRDVYDKRLLELSSHLDRYQQIAMWARPAIAPSATTGESWLPLIAYEKEAERMAEQKAKAMAQSGELDPKKMKDEELEVFFRGLLADSRRELSPTAAKYKEILDNYSAGNSMGFNNAVKEYNESNISHLNENERFRIKLETFFNFFAPFYLCSMLYLLVIVMGCFSWLGWSEPLRRSAFYLAIFTVILHTASILTRMYLQGRPPVTNLYSSAIFIGWGCVLLCIVLEHFFRNSIGNVVGAALGAATMVIAHKLAENGSSRGDTMEMLEAVLDTDLWLATHVTTVTLGYTATYVTGMIAIVYLIQGIFTQSVDDRVNKTFGQMMYGVTCFAMFLSFVGTVLGGIWADQSWGRFWGWDPKENGAVLVVIMNAMILHARWAGMIKQRGMAIMALVGNMVTTWSWFGTNQLGVGLHAYGFDKELAEGCRYFWLSQLALIGLASIPKRYWRSFSEETIRDRAATARRLEQEQKMAELEAKKRGKGPEPRA